MIDIINKAISKKLDSYSFTEVITGIVTSSNPLKIRINDRLEISGNFIDERSIGVYQLEEKVDMIRHNNGQKFYILGTSKGGNVYNWFRMEIREDGNLWMVTILDGDNPFHINSDGNLIVTI